MLRPWINSGCFHRTRICWVQILNLSVNGPRFTPAASIGAELRAIPVHRAGRPPALDLLTVNALAAADAVLIPMQAEYFALEGVSELPDTIGRIRQELNPALEIEGVVCHV